MWWCCQTRTGRAGINDLPHRGIPDGGRGTAWPHESELHVQGMQGRASGSPWACRESRRHPGNPPRLGRNRGRSFCRTLRAGLVPGPGAWWLRRSRRGCRRSFFRSVADRVPTGLAKVGSSIGDAETICVGLLRTRTKHLEAMPANRGSSFSAGFVTKSSYGFLANVRCGVAVSIVCRCCGVSVRWARLDR